MKCNQDTLIAYYYGELDEETNALIERHMEECMGCSEEFKRLKVLLDKVGVEGRLSSSQKPFSSYLEGVYEKTKKQKIWGLGIPVPRFVPAGIAIAIIAVFITAGVYLKEYREDSLLAQNYEVIQHLEFLQNMEVLQSMEELEMMGS